MMGCTPRIFDAIDVLTREDRVPADHCYRCVERSLDRSFVRPLVADHYAAGGRPSIDPVVFCKLQLVMVFEGIRSERQVLMLAGDRLSVRWYLGDDLGEALPDHSRLTRIRDRSGIDVFRRLFACIVEQCQQAGLVWGRELDIDATKVEANADIDPLVPRFVVDAHRSHLFAEPLALEQTALDTPAPSAVPVGGSELNEPLHTRHDWLAALGRPNRSIGSGPYQRRADFRASMTDPDASPMRTHDGRTCLGYQDHSVVDGGRARIILGVLVAPAEVQENQPALDLRWRARFRWPLPPRQVTGDTKYGTAENIVAREAQLVRAYVPLSAAGNKPGH